MFGDYSTVLITIGGLACVVALGWFFESSREASDTLPDSLGTPDDSHQRRRAVTYMTAVILTMAATLVSIG